MFNMWILLLSKTMLAYELLIYILFFRFVKTILITKLITDLDLKAHGGVAGADVATTGKADR